MNMAANFLGLGNAATPFGLKAMEELQKDNPRPDTALFPYGNVCGAQYRVDSVPAYHRGHPCGCSTGRRNLWISC